MSAPNAEVIDFRQAHVRYGRRRIDRREFEAHLCEFTGYEVEQAEGWAEHSRQRAGYFRERLAKGTYVAGRKVGQPLSRKTREQFQGHLAGFEAGATRAQSEAERLRAMLTDPCAVARYWTDCGRAPGVCEELADGEARE